MRAHVFETCSGCDAGCNFCLGGLLFCVVCKQAEVELEPECPGPDHPGHCLCDICVTLENMDERIRKSREWKSERAKMKAQAHSLDDDIFV